MIFALVSLYLIIVNLGYIWVGYSALYKQLSLWRFVLTFSLSFEVAFFGIGLFFYPAVNILNEGVGLRKMVLSSIVALLAGVLIVQMAFPVWSLLLAALLSGKT